MKIKADTGIQFVNIMRPALFTVLTGLSAVLILFVKFSTPSGEKPVNEKEYQILKLVDVQEYTPPPQQQNTVQRIVAAQPESSDTILETDDTVIEHKSEQSSEQQDTEPDYLPQHKISLIPEIPSKEILSRITYPPIALKQGIEGVVYLELFIDADGRIRKINVLKDPGYGFAEAAVDAIKGLICKPALVNGKPVPVRFRYPVRFSVK